MSSVTTVPVFVLAAVVAEAVCWARKIKISMIEHEDHHYTQGLV